jgi:hypothetical protein
MNKGSAGRLRRVTGSAILLSLAFVARPVGAQTDYYNLDKNRPARVEDALSVERYAFELKLATLRLERESGGVYHWGIDPELAYGILPRTHVEVGFPYAVIDGGEAGRRSGLSGIELSLFHSLNVETRTLPALAVRGDLVFPVGSLSGDRTYPAITGIGTRTFRWARLHLNAQYTFGDSAEGAEVPDDAIVVTGEEVSRWLVGVAADRAFPLSSFLLVGDVYARQPLHDDDPVQWNAGLGLRYQVNPYLAVDAGLGHRLTGGAGWYITFGTAYAFGARPFVPVPGGRSRE